MENLNLKEMTNRQLMATLRLSMGLTTYCRPDNVAEMPLDQYEKIEDILEELKMRGI